MFTKCEMVAPAVNAPNAAPIEFTSGPESFVVIGGIVFDGCTIRDAEDRPPMSYRDNSPGLPLWSITGTLKLIHGAQRTTYRLTPELIARWMPIRPFKMFTRIDTTRWRWQPAFPELKPEVSQRNTARQRGTAEWLLWIETAQKVSFNVRIQAVGNAEVKPVPVSLISPSGNVTKLAAAAPGKGIQYDFQVTERGAVRIVCEAQSATAAVNSPESRVCLYSPTGRFHLLGTTGQFWFVVPSSPAEFGITVWGGGGTECVKAAVLNPAGEKIQERDNIGRAHQFLITRTKISGDEIWCLSFDKPQTGVLEDFYVELEGIPGVISPTREGVLKRAK